MNVGAVLSAKVIWIVFGNMKRLILIDMVRCVERGFVSVVWQKNGFWEMV